MNKNQAAVLCKIPATSVRVTGLSTFFFFREGWGGVSLGYVTAHSEREREMGLECVSQRENYLYNYVLVFERERENPLWMLVSSCASEGESEF